MPIHWFMLNTSVGSNDVSLLHSIPNIIFDGIYLLILCTDVSGDIGPFQVAIALTVVTLGLILPWRENYGHGGTDNNGSSDSNSGNKSGGQSFLAWVKETWALLLAQPVILCLGLSQAFFEGAIYTFGTPVISGPSFVCYLFISYIVLLSCIIEPRVQCSCGCPVWRTSRARSVRCLRGWSSPPSCSPCPSEACSSACCCRWCRVARRHCVCSYTSSRRWRWRFLFSDSSSGPCISRS